MINKPTVLILGAGASALYDFPTGLKLMKMTINALNPDSGSTLPKYLKDHGIAALDIRRFLDGLSGSRKRSIDSFVEENYEFLKIAQLAITIILSELEDEDKLLNLDDDKCWYSYLWNNLSDHTSFDDFGKNKLSIITFNYDRSIELDFPQ